MRRCLLVISMFTIGLILIGTVHAADIRLTNDDHSSTLPRLAVDDNYVYVAWLDARDVTSGAEVYWKKLDLLGNEVVGDTRVTNTGGVCSWLDVGLDASGRTALTWQQGTAVMFLALDTDGSPLFSPVMVASGSCVRPAIATHTNGESTIVWDKDEGVLQKAYTARYNIAGALTCANLNLSPGDLVGYAKNPAVDLDPLGNAYASWFDIYNFSDGLWLSKRLASCTQTHNYQYLNTGEQPNVAITVPSENYFFAFMEQTTGGRKQVMCLASSLINISTSSGTARLPRIASAEAGECYAVWYDNRDSNNEIYLAITDGDCAIMSGPTRLTTDPAVSSNPDIAVSSSTPRDYWVVWQDNRDGNYEIYLSTSSIPQQPVISTDVTSLTFVANQNGTPPGSQIFNLSNAGIGDLDWSLVDDADWLELDPVSDVSNSQDITVTINSTELEVQEHLATITINSTNANNSPVVIDVSYLVSEPAPHICLDLAEIVFGAIEFESTPAERVFTVSNCGGGILDWVVDGIPTWLDVSPVSGSGVDEGVTLAVNTTALTPGTYIANLTINSTNADNSGLVVTVDYTVYPSGAIALVYGTSQPRANQPIADAYLEIFRNENLIERLGPTDATGILTPLNLQTGDEVYAYTVIGAGRTWKLLHPDMPDYLIPDPLPDPSCDPAPWSSFYFNYLDNQIVDQSDNLTKTFYDGSSPFFLLDHKIAKLQLTIGYDHNLPDDRFDIIVDSLKLGLNRTNRFLLDATNGLLMLDSVWILSGPTDIPYCDMRIARHTDLPGATVTSEGLKYPGFFLIGSKMFFGREDIVDFNLWRGLTHELGHYFLNLGDEYPATYDGVKYGGLCDNPDNRSSIMKSTVNVLPTEFCDLNHSTEPTMHQNVLHNGQSCWEYLSNEWNSFESELSLEFCPWILRGTTIEWSRPDHAVDYVRGPYIDMEQTTSHEISFTVTALPSLTTNDIQIVVRRDERNGGFIIIVFGSGSFRADPDMLAVDTVRYVRHFDESQYNEEILIPSVEQYDQIYIVGDKSLPVVLSSDTVNGPLDISLQGGPAEDAPINMVSASADPSGLSVTFRLHTVPAPGETWVATAVQSGGSPTSLGMTAISDSIQEVVVVLDTSESLGGVVVFEQVSTGYIIAERWENVKLSTTTYNYYEILGSYGLAGPHIQGSDSMWATVLTTPLPDYVDRSLDQTYPSRPIHVSFSGPLSETDSLSLGILGGPGIDSLATMVKVVPGSTEMLQLETVVLSATGFAYSKIGGSGLYFLGVAAPDICCGVYTDGRAGNVDCSSDGKRNLADITRLIDRIYVSKFDLCCEPDGNVDGDAEAKMNLADITRLIDHVYISKAETAACQ